MSKPRRKIVGQCAYPEHKLGSVFHTDGGLCPFADVPKKRKIRYDLPTEAGVKDGRVTTRKNAAE